MNMKPVLAAIARADEEVTFYGQRIVRLDSAVRELNKHFTDHNVVLAWYGHIEACRDNLSRLLDKADGKK